MVLNTMNTMQWLGAEALVKRQGSLIIKTRIQKSYRNESIDSALRSFRTRREAKVIGKLNAIGFPCPKLISVDEKSATIKLECVEGSLLKDVLEDVDYAKSCQKIGELVADMHNQDIIHADLTTSNIIIANIADDMQPFFIDFGLSFFSHKAEDKAVDLHLFRQSLESRHYAIVEKCMKYAFKGYNRAKDYERIVQRYKVVENRGRYKTRD